MRVGAFTSSAPVARGIVQALDVISVWVAGLAAYFWHVGDGPMPPNYSELILCASLLMLVASADIHRSWRGGAFRIMLGSVAVSWLGTWLVVLVWLVLSKSSTDYSRIWLVSWALGTLLLLWTERFVVYFILRWMRQKGYNQKQVVLIGDTPTLKDIQKRVGESAWTGYSIVDHVTPNRITHLQRVVTLNSADEVWISLPADNMQAVEKVLHALRYSTANIRMVPDLLTYRLMNHGMSLIMGLPMLDLSTSPMEGPSQIAKWFEDRVLGLLMLILASPVMLAVAIGVKLSSPGPVFFRQRRHGWNGDVIEVYKFRSMVIHREQSGQVTQATKKDRRITRFGRFIRRTSLDELPQLFNVVKGQMSIVGPRPHALAHNEQYKELVPHYMLRHKVKPGITGWAQINGLRGETDSVEKMRLRVEHDLEYIENWSLWRDIKIIFLTVFKGFTNTNAY